MSEENPLGKPMSESEEMQQAEALRNTLITCLCSKLLHSVGGTLTLFEDDLMRWTQHAILIENGSSQEKSVVRFTVVPLDEAKRLLSKIMSIRERRN